MASRGEEVEEVIQAAGMEEVAELLTNKNLYLSFYGAAIILGIKMELSKDGLGLSAKETPGIIQNPELLCKWYSRKNGSLPTGMGALVKDSKVYMIGGEHLNGEDINRKTGKPRECCSKASASMLVYEFDIADDGQPAFKETSLVPQLPIGMPAPFIVNHLGQTFVLYGREGFGKNCRHNWAKEPVLGNCFLVLRKDGMGWKSICTPFFDEHSSRHIWFHSAIGSKLYVLAHDFMCSYDVMTGLWEHRRRGAFWTFPQGSITLSFPVSITEANGQSTYVVISNLGYSEKPRFGAALVDRDGNIASKFQTIHYATRGYESTGNFKLIELMYKDDSSTFALVFISHDGALGLAVFRVSLVSSSKRVDTETDFLETEVLVNQRYILSKDQLNFNYGVIDDVIFR